MMDPRGFYLILFWIYFHFAIFYIHYYFHNRITNNTALILYCCPFSFFSTLSSNVKGKREWSFPTHLLYTAHDFITLCKMLKFSRLKNTALFRFLLKNKRETFQTSGYSYCSFLCLFYFYCIFFPQFEWAVLHAAGKMQEHHRETTTSISNGSIAIA